MPPDDDESTRAVVVLPLPFFIFFFCYNLLVYLDVQRMFSQILVPLQKVGAGLG